VTGQRRQLGLVAATAIVTGESISLGIFLTPASMSHTLASPLLVALVWLAMALMTLSGALCYAELAVRYPVSGGEYVYLEAGYGKQTAFLYGWMSSIIMYPGVAAALAVGMMTYFVQVAPIHGLALSLAPALLLCVFCIVNLIGTRLSGGLMSTLNMVKLALLFGLVTWAAISGRAHVANLFPLAQRQVNSMPLLPAIAGATVGAFFSFGGWWELGKLAGEIRDPRRTLPLALLGGVSIVTVVYLLISGMFLAVVPIGRVTTDTGFIAQFGAALFGSAGGRILSACVVLCVLGGISALTMAAPRVCFAMARRGAFFAPFGREHPRFGTPANAILLQTGLSLGVLSLGAFDRVLSYIIFSAILFLALTVSTMFRAKVPVRAWWYPWAPVLFIAFCVLIDLLILMHDPLPALTGVAIILLGIPLRRFVAGNITPTFATEGGNS